MKDGLSTEREGGVAMHDRLIKAEVRRQELLRRLVSEEDGEGVISTAIAVLVMAFLGAAMWIGFNAIFGDAQGRISSQVNTIGG
jgi:hypothetical protein